MVTRHFCFLVGSLIPGRGMFNCCPYLKVEESQAQKGGNSPEVTEPVSPRVLGTWCFFPKTPLRTLWKKLALDHSEAQQAIQNLPQAWGYQGLQPVCQFHPKLPHVTGPCSGHCHKACAPKRSVCQPNSNQLVGGWKSDLGDAQEFLSSWPHLCRQQRPVGISSLLPLL